MKKMFLLVVIASWFSLSELHAACSNPRQVTPYMPGNPGITEFGAVQFTADCSLEPGETDLTWSWEFEGQVVQNSDSFTMSPSTSGQKFVKFRSSSCFPGGCGGGGTDIEVLLAKRPVLTLGTASACAFEQMDSTFGYMRRADIASNVSPDDPVSTGSFVTWEKVSGPPNTAGGFSWLGGNQSAMTANAKGTYVGRAFATASYPKTLPNGVVVSYFAVSAPQEITVSCPNMAPDLISAQPNVGSVEVGFGVGFQFNAREPDAPVGDHITSYKVVASGPVGATIEAPSLSQLEFVPTVSGAYLLEMSVKDEEGLSSIIRTGTLTATGNVAKPSFKVRLGGATGKEYLFDTCAPFNDPCKQFKDSHVGGEFLLGDQVTLDARGNEQGLTKYIWTAGPVVGPPQQFEDTNSTRSFTFNTLGDYSIALEVEKNGARSEALTKLVKVQNEILIYVNQFFQFTPSSETGEPATAFGGNEHFCGKDTKGKLIPCKFGYFKTKQVRKKGCLLANTSTIFSKHIPTLPTRLNPAVTNPITADDVFVRRLDYLGSADLSLSDAFVTHNILSGAEKLAYSGQSFKTMSELEHLARKRQLAFVEVKSVNIPEDFDPNALVECKILDPETGEQIGTLSKEECENRARHFVLLNGIEAGEGIRIVDPNNNTNTLLSQFGNQFRNIRLLTPTVGQSRPSISIGLDNPNIAINLTSPGGGSIGTASTKSTLNGFVDRLTIADVSGDSEREPLSGGDMIVLPDFTETGSYQIALSSNFPQRGTVDIRVRDAGGNLSFVRREPVQVDPGAPKILTFHASQNAAMQGSIGITKFTRWADLKSKKEIVRIEGDLGLSEGSNGVNLAQDGMNLLFGSNGIFLSAPEILNTAAGAVFSKPDAVSGLRYFRLNSSQKFIMELVSPDLGRVFQGEKLTLMFSTGDDFFNGELKMSQFSGPPLFLVEISKPEYAVGERADIRVTARMAPTNPELEFFLEAKVNGAKNLVIPISSTEWTTRTPRLTSGVHTVSLQLYQQNKRLADSIRSSVNSLRKEIFEIEERIARETDPEIISELEAKKQKLLSYIDSLESELRKSRRALGGAVDEVLSVR